MKQELFALIDCNNFYVSCERAFRPSLENKPVVVLSNNDGCIVSRSNEVKALGIKMASPAYKCADLVATHQIHVFSSNYALYGDMSARVMETLRTLISDIEIYSIDEAFARLNEDDDNLALGRAIKQRIRQWTGIPVSVGIAPTKVLAKVANEIAKTRPEFGGVFGLRMAEVDEWLAQLDVRHLWGIGRRYEKLLKDRGIYNALQLKNSPDWWITRYLTRHGMRLVNELRGIPCLPLEEIEAPRKGIASSRSFAGGLTSLKDLKEAVATYVTRGAEKLREQGLTASHLDVSVRTNLYNADEKYNGRLGATLPRPTSYTPELIDWAEFLLNKIYREGYRYWKAGIFLSGLIPEGETQLSLLEQVDPEKRRSIMKTVDAVNRKYSSSLLHFAAQGTGRSWQTKRSSVSPRYTTDWNELPRIKARD